jgi:uncharacterized membrane protein YfcA
MTDCAARRPMLDARDFPPVWPAQSDMDFLGTPDVGMLTFLGLMLASLVTSFIGVFTGAAGGIVLLGLMATVMPPLALIPVHTVVMLGTGATRTMIMWRNVMRPAVLPFLAGSLIGAAFGAKVFVALTAVWLEFILGSFILLVTWMPKLGRFGAERGRFALIGFAVTFVGVFVSATGSMLAPFVAASTPDRRVHVATMGALMTITHLAKIAAFGVIGFAIGRYAPLMVAMIVTGAVGNWVGEVALLRTKEQHFRLLLQLALTLLGLRLLWSAASGAGWI